jgi:HEAT repeat protein
MGRAKGRSRWLLGAAAVALLLTDGCAFLDDFSIKRMNFEDFRDPPNPLEVARNSPDGTLRQRAIRCLKEPLSHGGTQKDQDIYVDLLNYLAANDRQALCRMAAIDVLRQYKDPRAVDGLKEAYYRAGSFDSYVANKIRCLALQALGETHQPAAVETLVRVLREPPAEGPDVDKQEKLDERMAAARSLGNFKQYQATAALVDVLKKDQDVALRRCAHESLESATGRDIPPDAVQWAEFLNNPGASKAPMKGSHVGGEILQAVGLK